MSDSVTPPPVPTDVAAAQDPWPEAPDTPDDGEAGPEPDGNEELAPEFDDEVPTGSFLARIASDRLAAFATPAQIGLIVLGSLGAFNALGPGRATSQQALGLLVTVGLLLVAGALAGSFVRGFSALLAAQAEQAEATGRIEQHLAAGLERLSAALEGLANAPRAPEASAVELKAQHLAEIRHAVRSRRWDEAADLVRTFSETRPEDPDAPRIAAEVGEARQSAGQELLARVEAAREVNDPERVIELRDELRPLLDSDALHALDRDLARWFLLLISKRLRAGTVRADVAVLAARVAESLGGTPEGASLRASLPTLRRAAGLCARCGQPYTGVADACPACLGGPRAASEPVPAPSAPSPPSSSVDGQEA